MKKYPAKLSLVALSLGFAATMVFPARGSAAFNTNNIMDDNVFNMSTMNAADIDAFLNSFPSSCVSTNNGFVSANVVGYNPTQGFLYGSSVSAGTVIYNAARAYDLNPQVILATLQKEQSLVTGSAGCHYDTPPTQNSRVVACQYAGGCVYIAMGYDCPSDCNASSTGFSRQIIKATWKLKFVQQRSLGNYNWNVQKPGWDNSDDPTTNYNGYMTQGFLKRNAWSDPANYDGYRPVNNNSLTVHLDTGATASLYSYTPLTSGNQSFVSRFEEWFGPTTKGLVTTDNGAVYKIEDGQKRVFPDGITFSSYSYKWTDIITISSSQLSQIPDGPPMPYYVHFRDGKYVKPPDTDNVYLIENGLKRPVPDGITLLSYSYRWSDIVTISTLEMSKIPEGPVVPYYVHFRDGKLVKSLDSDSVYLVEDGQKRVFPDGETFSSYSYRWSDIVTISTLEMSKIPEGPSMPKKS